MESGQKLVYSCDECCALLGLSRNSMYAAIAKNSIPHLRVGRRILISRRKIEEMLEGSAQPAAK